MTGWIYNWARTLWYDVLVVWLDRYMSKPSSDFWLKVKKLQLCNILDWDYIREIFSIRYGTENYDNKVRYKAVYGGCRKIRRHLIVGLKEYNIQ